MPTCYYVRFISYVMISMNYFNGAIVPEKNYSKKLSYAVNMNVTSREYRLHHFPSRI